MSAPSPQPTATSSPLEQRLQQTNERIVHLLDQMSWKEAPEATSPDAPAAVGDLLTTCRPFDRAAYLAFVATYSPLVWSHKDADALSPLACARFGWVCSPSLAQRDTLCCTLCHATLHVHFAAEIQSHPTAVAALAAKYADLLVTSHTADCSWKDNPYEENFARILPSEPMERDTAVWIALNQLRARTTSLTHYSALRALTLHSDFVEQYRQLLQNATSASSPDLPLPSLLAICGWESRSIRAPAASAASLTCWFGCREVSLEHHSDATDVVLTIPEGKEEVEESTAGDEEERSIFQSPLKRRRILPTDNKLMRSFSLDAAAPLLIRPSPTGFHPVRSHRPFCPFVQPLPSSPASSTAPLSASALPHSSSVPTDADAEPPLGWEAILAWYMQRQHPSRPTAASAEDDGTASSASASSLPFKSVVATVKQLLFNTFDSARAVIKREP